MRRCLNCMEEYSEDNREICPYCGYVDGKTQDGALYLPPGSILQGRYIVGTVIAARDVDVIYHGWDALFERKVQIQEYFPIYCATRAGKPQVSIYDAKQERYQAGLELFYRQSRELLRLYKDDGVVTYHACFEENKTAYAIVDGRNDKTLEEWIGGRTIKVKEAFSLLWEVIGAVDECHRFGVYHGLISTATFWVTGAKKLILKDFGAWRYCSGEPGIVDYDKAGIQTDVYGVAKLFCQMITGKDITDGEKLEAELLKCKITLKSAEVAALKRALSHDTKSLRQFRDEMYGSAGKKRLENSNRIRTQRKNARNSLALPGWVVGGVAAVVIAALVSAALIGSGVFEMKIKSGESKLDYNQTRVPNVVNKSADDAEKALRKQGLKMSRDKMVYSKEVPPDKVSYQEIKEGTVVEKSTALVVWISMGAEKGAIPAVTGLQREEAEERLKTARFTNIKIEESQDEGVYNSVLAISEQSGENVELDKEIVITICVNENAQDGDSSVQVRMQDLAGMNKEQAQMELAQARFQINWVEEFSDEPEGTVLEQEPKAGQEVNQGYYVTVHVSKGTEKIYMKNVQLMTEKEARSTIESLGLTVGTVAKEYSSSVAAGKVITQSVALNTEVRKGDVINLVISNGSDPAKQTTGAISKTKSQVPATTEAARKQAETAAAANMQEQAEAEAERQTQAEAAANVPDLKGVVDSVLDAGKAKESAVENKATEETVMTENPNPTAAADPAGSTDPTAAAGPAGTPEPMTAEAERDAVAAPTASKDSNIETEGPSS